MNNSKLVYLIGNQGPKTKRSVRAVLSQYYLPSMINCRNMMTEMEISGGCLEYMIHTADVFLFSITSFGPDTGESPDPYFEREMNYFQYRLRTMREMAAIAHAPRCLILGTAVQLNVINFSGMEIISVPEANDPESLAIGLDIYMMMSEMKGPRGD